MRPLALVLLAACGQEVVLEPSKPTTPAPTPATEQPVPAPSPSKVGTDPCTFEAELVYPSKLVTSPLAVEETAEHEKVRKILTDVLNSHGRDPQNPWAIGHAMLALGPDVVLTNGEPAVPWLFKEYGQFGEVNGVSGVEFPSRRGLIRIEPHTDLLLKAITEGGVKPGTEVVVDGKKTTVDDLYRRSACAAWIDGDRLSFESWNDAPWALQGLAQWAPDDLAWTADGGKEMSMDAFTSATVTKLASETEFLRDAQKAGTPVQKRRQRIFAYTCGGAHMIQGTAWAVGRGFGSPADRIAVEKEISTYLARIDIELPPVDKGIQDHPDYAPLLLVQRMKFLGHLLETVHKAAALGVWTPTDAEKAEIARVDKELVWTVLEIEKRGYIQNLKKIRADNEQLYLDVIGDSAHALRGLDLHNGKGVVRL